MENLDLGTLTNLMIKHGLVIRAIPYESVGIFEPYHKDKYDGEITYNEEFKRDMLHVVTKNENGGKFIIASKLNTNHSIENWHKEGSKTKFYDSIDQAVIDFLSEV